MPAGSLFFYQGGKRFLGAPPSLLLLPLSPASAPPPSPLLQLAGGLLPSPDLLIDNARNFVQPGLIPQTFLGTEVKARTCRGPPHPSTALSRCQNPLLRMDRLSLHKHFALPCRLGGACGGHVGGGGG